MKRRIKFLPRYSGQGLSENEVVTAYEEIGIKVLGVSKEYHPPYFLEVDVPDGWVDDFEFNEGYVSDCYKVMDAYSNRKLFYTRLFHFKSAVLNKNTIRVFFDHHQGRNKEVRNELNP